VFGERVLSPWEALLRNGDVIATGLWSPRTEVGGTWLCKRVEKFYPIPSRQRIMNVTQEIRERELIPSQGVGSLSFVGCRPGLCREQGANILPSFHPGRWWEDRKEVYSRSVLKDLETTPLSVLC
jgi:hypothetical protein